MSVLRWFDQLTLKYRYRYLIKSRHIRGNARQINSFDIQKKTANPISQKEKKMWSIFYFEFIAANTVVRFNVCIRFVFVFKLVLLLLWVSAQFHWLAIYAQLMCRTLATLDDLNTLVLSSTAHSKSSSVQFSEWKVIINYKSNWMKISMCRSDKCTTYGGSEAIFSATLRHVMLQALVSNPKSLWFRCYYYYH